MAHKLPRVGGVAHQFPRIGERAYHVAEAGDPDAQPVVLLHGWPQHWYAWRHVIPLVARDHRVLAMDLRGFGWSDIAWDGFEKDRMAHEVVAVLDELAVGRVGVVGHDWGGWIGLLLALEHADRVERVVALNTPPPWSRAAALHPRRLRHQLALAGPGAAARLRRTEWAAAQVRRLAQRRENLSAAELAIYVRDLRASTRARAGKLLHRAYVRRELPRILAGGYATAPLRVPSLLLLGERDRVAPCAEDGLRRADDDLRAEVVAGTGHFLPEEAPELVAERAIAFFAQAPDPVPARVSGA